MSRGGNCVLAVRFGPPAPRAPPQLAASWGLPGDVSRSLQFILFAESVAFQSFRIVVNVNSRTGQMTEYVGAARRVNGVAQVAIAHVDAHVGLRPRYVLTSVKTCHRCWIFGRCCVNSRVKTLRGYTEDELRRVETAMRATSYQKLVEIINQGPVNFIAAADDAVW